MIRSKSESSSLLNSSFTDGIISHFGDESFQSVTRTGTGKKQPTQYNQDTEHEKTCKITQHNPRGTSKQHKAHSH